MAGDELELVAVIMAGGAGTRFWPLSTSRRPKQFLKLLGDRSLLQESWRRVSDLVPAERALVLTHAVFVDLVREQLPEIPPQNVIGEPQRKDTAAAVCLGALLCRSRFGNPVMAVLTADHVIEPVGDFHRTLLSAAREARGCKALYTFGIRPSYPATGYGYLEVGPRICDDGGIEHYRLLRFKEKPDPAKALQYVQSGRFQWNSGMFVWTTDVILEAVGRHLPDHLEAMSAAVDLEGTEGWAQALRQAFEGLAPISIDYGVMEKADDVRCVACGFQWTDLGGWPALGEFLPRDDEGNAFRGNLFCLDAHGNLVYCENSRETVVLVGVEDLIVVRAGKRTLIVPRAQAERIKELVRKMEGVG